MSPAARTGLSLRRKTGFGSTLFRFFRRSHNLRDALSDAYSVSLEENGATRQVQVAGHSEEDIDTDWRSSGDQKKLLDYLNRYRMSPENCKPDASIRQMLRRFLFCEGVLDGPVTTLWKPGGELYLKGDDGSLPLLLNVPWELADGVPALGGHEALGGTLAAWPLARIAAGLTSSTVFEQERLRVGYCISEPPGVTKIGAERFQQWFDLILGERSGMLEYKRIASANFAPRLDTVKAEIRVSPVHILVIVSHGRTVQGKPQLRLEQWTPVEEIANAVAAAHKTFLVLVIACDQVFLEDGPAAHSGAYRFLEAGIPAVVAMQSKVRAQMAATFLGTLLDGLMRGLALAAAVAEGRKSMAPASSKVFEEIDWSFPALFQTQDGHDRIRDLSEYFQFRPALEALLRSIPKSEGYFPRGHVEAALEEFLRPRCAGLKSVVGAAEAGRTETIREVCRNAIRAAIDTGGTCFRPILYLDLSCNRDAVVSATGLIAMLLDRVEEVKPAVSGPSLIDLRLPRARGADGSGLVADQVRQLVELIDLANFTLLLDNADEAKGAPWDEFFAGCTTLLHSAVIVGVNEGLKQPVLEAESIVEVSPLTQEETRGYVQRFRPERIAEADGWFGETAGLPYLLHALVENHGSSEGSFPMTIAGLPAPDRQLIYTLALLPSGLSTALAWDFLPNSKEASVPSLVRRGLVLSETRVSQQWLRIPGMIGQSLRISSRNLLDAAAEELAAAFAERVGGEEVEREIVDLADRLGGIPFLHDVQAVLIDVGSETSLEQARALPVLLHKHLFRKGRWWDVYLLTKRVLTVLPPKETEASEWLQLAKAQHALGLQDELEKSLATVAQPEMERGIFDEVDLIDLRIAALKDAGARERLPEMFRMYEDAFALLDRAPDKDTAAIRGKRATLHYNRGILRQHWGKDLNGALRDLEAAEEGFRELGDRNMEAMAATEWVDVQLSAPGERNWSGLFDRLAHALDLLKKLQAAGDLAFCQYQFARFYRRKPADTIDEQRRNLSKARAAYEDAAHEARIAGDSRQEAAAEGHIVEVAWKDLEEIPTAEAVRRLDSAIARLRTFHGDAWSCRLTRDLLATLAMAQLREGQDQAALTTLAAAWVAATTDPLKPSSGTDARRAAHILKSYLERLDESKPYEGDVIASGAKPLIEIWLKQHIDATTRGWLGQVQAFGKGPGEYDG